MSTNGKRFILLIFICLVGGACAMPQLVTRDVPPSGLPQNTPSLDETSLSLQKTVYALQTQVASVSATAAAPTVEAAPSSTLPSPTSPGPLSSVTAGPGSTPQPTDALTGVPSAVASITPTATLSGPCNKADFVTDLSVPDYTYVNNGQTFTKTWRLRNSGFCAWTTNYALVFDQGYLMGNTRSVNLATPVLPGQTVDISVTLTAPAGNGVFQGYWQLQDDNGHRFGVGSSASGSFWVKITTGIIETSTPSISGNCQVGAVFPDMNASFSPGNDFDMRWTVTNISGSTWSAATVDYVYVSGAKIYKYTTTVLPEGTSVFRS